MLQICLTPAMIIFRTPTSEHQEMLKERYQAERNVKGDLFIKSSPQQLYKILLELSYEYDMEIF